MPAPWALGPLALAPLPTTSGRPGATTYTARPPPPTRHTRHPNVRRSRRRVPPSAMFDFDGGPSMRALERAVTLINRVIPSGGESASGRRASSSSTTTTPSVAAKPARERWVSFSATATAVVPVEVEGGGGQPLAPVVDVGVGGSGAAGAALLPSPPPPPPRPPLPRRLLSSRAAPSPRTSPCPPTSTPCWTRPG